MRFLKAALLVSLTSGCSLSYRYISSAKAPARAEHCDIHALSLIPPGGYDELGFFEFESGGATRNTADFLQSVGPRICAAGGDAVATELNGQGFIVRAVVLKKKSAAEQ